MAKPLLQLLEKWAKAAACILGVCISLAFHQLFVVVLGSHMLALLAMILCAIVAYLSQETDEERAARENYELEILHSLLQRRKVTVDKLRDVCTLWPLRKAHLASEESSELHVERPASQDAHAEEPGLVDAPLEDVEERFMGLPNTDARAMPREVQRPFPRSVLDGVDLDELRQECHRLEQLLAAGDDNSDFAFSAPSPVVQAQLRRLLQDELEKADQQADDADNDGDEAFADDTDGMAVACASAAKPALVPCEGDSKDSGSLLRRRRPAPSSANETVGSTAGARE